MAQYDVYGIGNALLDIEYDVTPSFLHQHEIEKGIMTLVDDQRQEQLIAAFGDREPEKVASGGSAANTMVAIQQFGGQGYYSCKIANDRTGDLYLKDMQAAGLDSPFSKGQAREEGHTGTCLVMVTADADRTMNTYLGITETLGVEQLDYDALKTSKYLYLEGYMVASDTALTAALDAKHFAERHGIKTTLTLSDPAIVKFFKPQFKQLLALGVDVLFCNEEEALEFTDTHLFDGAKEALKSYARQFVITRGSKGSVVYDGENFIEIAPYKVNAVDTIGAGDMYAGAFLYGLTHDMSWEKAGQLASAASAAVIEQYGPRLTQSEVQALLAKCQEMVVA